MYDERGYKPYTFCVHLSQVTGVEQWMFQKQMWLTKSLVFYEYGRPCIYLWATLWWDNTKIWICLYLKNVLSWASVLAECGILTKAAYVHPLYLTVCVSSLLQPPPRSRHRALAWNWEFPHFDRGGDLHGVHTGGDTALSPLHSQLFPLLTLCRANHYFDDY